MARNITEFIEIPDLDGVSVVRHTGPSPTEARHMHQSLCIGAVISGEKALLIGGVHYSVPAGQSMVIPPETSHACPDAGECEYVMVSVPVSCLERGGFALETVFAARPVNDDPICFGAVLGLVEMVEVPVSRLERQGRLMRVLGSVCRDVDRKEMCSSEPDRVRRVRRFLEERCAEDVPLSTLAQLAGCSPWRLNRDFASVVGMPPHEYQAMQRVRMVKECIRDGKSLAESGVEAGFADQSHMTRCFKKVMGMTPGKFAHGLPSSRSN